MNEIEKLDKITIEISYNNQNKKYQIIEYGKLQKTVINVRKNLSKDVVKETLKLYLDLLEIE